jgi:BASS family bile acid:Na+ symporter
MFLLSGAERILIVVFLCSTMLGFGLQASLEEMRSLLVARGYVFRALFANFVLVPLVGLGLIRLVPLSHAAGGALLLLACIPGGLGTIKYTRTVKGEASRAGALFVLLCILAVPVSPLLLRWAAPASLGFSVPYDRVLAVIALLILVPLGIGLLVRRQWPHAAERWPKFLAIVGTVSFLVFMVRTKIFRKEALGNVSIPAIGAMLALLLAAMAIGWLLGGPARSSRQVLATSTSMRNAAFCLAIANSSPAGEALIAPLLGYTLLMVPPNLVFTLYQNIRAKRAARRTIPPPGDSGHGT